jgi:hypothetical protein
MYEIPAAAFSFMNRARNPLIELPVGHAIGILPLVRGPDLDRVLDFEIAWVVGKE